MSCLTHLNTQNLWDHLQKNCGAAAARNTATRAATGRYIAFLDSDDYWLPDKLSVQIRKMQEAAASFSCTSFIVWSGKRGVLIAMPEKINYNYLLRGNIFSTSTVVYDTGTIGNISKRAGIYKISLPSLALLERSTQHIGGHFSLMR